MTRQCLTWITAAALACSAGAAEFEPLMIEAASVARDDPAKGIKAYAQALAAAEKPAQRREARSGMARSLIRNGDLAKGLQTMAEGLEAEDVSAYDRAEDWQALGEALMSAREYAGARAVFIRLAEDETLPAHFRAMGWSGVGRAEYALGRLREAEAAYETAVALPGVAPVHLRDAWRGLMECALAREDYAGLRAVCKRILAAENADAMAVEPARRNLGRSYEAEGLYPEALAAYLAYIKDQGERFRGVETVERVDVLFRKQLRKARALFDAGDVEAARHEYLRVPEMERVEGHHTASAILGAARCLEAMGKPAEARNEYARVLDMPAARRPDRGRAQMGIARCHEAEGNESEAQAAYAALLDMKNVSRFDRAAAAKRLEALKK